MAGIGFELRKLFRQEGLVNHIKAYTYSSLTTIGPMVLSMLLIIALQRIMNVRENSYQEWELYIATVAYCFIFSIVLTSGISIVLTRYIADQMYEKKYNRLMSSYYGALTVMLPLSSIISVWFLSQVEASFPYKLAAYFFFMLLIVIWIQGVYLSALKDYIRIVRSYMIATVVTLLIGWITHRFTNMEPTTAALLALDIGFFIIVLLSSYHFEQRFEKKEAKYFFEFFRYFNKYRTLFFSGCFVYSGVYLHNFVYWLSSDAQIVANQFRIMPFYDLAVYFAFVSVMPTLVTFVVTVETNFYEKFRTYYSCIIGEGTIKEISIAKRQMQKTLMKEIGFLMEVQLLFTILALALGIQFLPRIGFTMAQLDLFIILALAYFIFIMLFVLVHILMYFDDRKGVFSISLLFVILNIGFSYWMMNVGWDGYGMFVASFIALLLVITRLLYVLRNIDYYTFCSQPINFKEKNKGRSALRKIGMLSSLICIIALTSACQLTDTPADDGTFVNRAEPAESVSTQLIEDKRLYERDIDDSLKTLYITILPDRNTDDPLDWYGLNRLPIKGDDRNLDIIMQEGYSDGSGPRSGMFGYAATDKNATIELRGNTAWYASQKSYRIKLTDEAGMYLDQSTLNLNKHISDLSRMRNKLSFDLFETIPNMTSLRTQFIHLYVKDLTTGDKSAEYVDYGLYTHVEQPNKSFLRSHLLDPNGYLYKVSFFEYGRYPDQIKSQDDPTYDPQEFETILEIKGREEHERLIQMLEDVNNYSMPIEEVMEKHFDLDNFLTWTAANILMDNMDTDANNFYLYSPLNSEKWYILPWDYDGGWELQRSRNDILPYQSGISNYWGSILHNRYFRKESHVEQLKEKIEELYATYINAETIKTQIDKYKDVVEPFLTREPDIRYLPQPASQFSQDLEVLVNTPERAIERFLEDLQKPKPFYQHDVVQTDGQLTFGWDLSFDLQDDALEYEIVIAKDPTMNDIVYEQGHIKENTITIPVLNQGIYYWKLSVTDEQGNSQFSFDYYLDADDNYYFGMREFEVK